MPRHARDRRSAQSFLLSPTPFACVLALSLGAVAASEVNFIYTSDAHYGIPRATFQGGTNIDAQPVNQAMVAQMKKFMADPGVALPGDGGFKSGATLKAIDFLVETGDISNRFDSSKTPAYPVSAVSWGMFKTDYLDGLTSYGFPIYLAPGNHDVSNAVGFYSPVPFTVDATAMAEIFNRMPGTFAPATARTAATYDYATDKVHYSFDKNGIRFVVINMWPDSTERTWLDNNLKGNLTGIPAATGPVILFTHDQPAVESKHFTNPNTPFDINSTDKFENLLAEKLHNLDGSVGGASKVPTSAASTYDQRQLVAFLKQYPNLTVYFHGNDNQNECYTYNGPDGDLGLHVARVDSPMKGNISATDETQLSFQVVSIDTTTPTAMKMTVRECLWNATKAANATLVWGASTTWDLIPRPVITTQPTAASVALGAKATFSVVASGSPTYQWQSQASGSTTWTSITGATAASYTTPTTTAADISKSYRCLVSNSGGMIGSAPATLTITGIAPNFLIGMDTIRHTGSTVTVAKDSGKYDSKTKWSLYYGGATDSASSGTAFATGFKSDDGNVAWLPGDPGVGGNRSANNGSLKTIVEVVREIPGKPKAIGVVTTVEFSHATPAVFVSHNVMRGNYWQIGDEIINTTKPEVVIGAGHPLYEGNYGSTTIDSTKFNYNYLGPVKSTTDATNYNKLKDGSAGYTFVERKAGVTTAGTDLKTAAAGATKLFGLFGGTSGYMEQPVAIGGEDANGNGAFTVGSAENPSLTDSAVAAITVLSKNANGFFLMVEGGDIDWANHADHFNWMLGGMKQFDDAVKTGVSLVDSNQYGMSWSNTLFIVAADHGNSYMRLNRAKPMGLGILPGVDANGIPNDLSVLFGGQSAYSATVWNSHTNELVNFYARGAGAELFDQYMDSAKKGWYASNAKNMIDQTHIFEVMNQAATRTSNPVKNIVFWIPDGMQKAHEVAYSRYRYGSDIAMPWDAWVESPGVPVRKGVVATWDVTGYNQRCFTYPDPTALTDATKTAPVYNRDNVEANTDHAKQIAYAKIGYDPARGGIAANVYSDEDTATQRAYLLTKFGAPLTRVESGDPLMTVTFTASNSDNSLFKTQPAIDANGHLTFEPAPGAVGNATVTVTATNVYTTGGSAVPGATPVTKTFTIAVSGVAAPTFSVATGYYATSQNVTLTAAAGASIYYTTDGTLPTVASTAYSTAIPVATTTTLYAIAVVGGGVSPIATAIYTIPAPASAPVAPTATPTFSVASGAFETAQTVTIACTTTGAVIRYTTDGSNPTATSPIYTAPVALSSTTTLKAMAMKTGMGDSALATSTYTIAPALPVFSLAGGTYAGARSVAITTTTAGAVIYYTTDGSIPTTASPVYASALSVNSTTTINAIAAKSGIGNSAMVSATYTIVAAAQEESKKDNKCGMGSGLGGLAAVLMLMFVMRRRETRRG